MQTTTAPQPVALEDLFPVDDFAKAHPNVINVALLRWQLRHRSTNGLAPAVIPLGKKLLISKSRYEAWLAQRAGVSA